MAHTQIRIEYGHGQRARAFKHCEQKGCKKFQRKTSHEHRTMFGERTTAEAVNTVEKKEKKNKQNEKRAR